MKEQMARPVQPWALCDASSITAITQILHLIKLSGIDLAGNSLVQKNLQNMLDI